MLKTLSLRIYPSKDQKVMMSKNFGSVRFIYNNTLAYRIETYEATKKGVSANTTIKRITTLKQEFPWLCEAQTQSLQQACRHLDKAYKNFFRTKKGFPKFKKKESRQSASYPQGVSIDFDVKELRLPKIGYVKFRDDRVWKGLIKTCTLVKTCTDKYFLQVLMDDGLDTPTKKEVKEDTTIGIDLGLENFAICSNGLIKDNPKFYRKSEKQLKRFSRKLSKAKKGSSNRKKVNARLNKVHEKIKNKRKYFLHELSKKFISENQIDTFVFEDLCVKGMIQNKRLSKSIGDASWSEFVRQVLYKSNWCGKNVLFVPRFYPSSKTCFECKHINNELKLEEREWVCPNCHTLLNRDINAAKNIKYEGLRLYFERLVSTGGSNGFKASGEIGAIANSVKEEISL